MYIATKAVSMFFQLCMNIATMALMEGGEIGQQGRKITPGIASPIKAEKVKVTSTILT